MHILSLFLHCHSKHLIRIEKHDGELINDMGEHIVCSQSALTLTFDLCLAAQWEGEEIAWSPLHHQQTGLLQSLLKGQGHFRDQIWISCLISTKAVRQMLNCNYLKCLRADLGGGGEEERDFPCLGSSFHAQCHGSSLPRSWTHHHCQELPAGLRQWGKILCNSGKIMLIL